MNKYLLLSVLIEDIYNKKRKIVKNEKEKSQ